VEIIMQERDIFDEIQETKTANFACPSCRERNDYEVRWMKRTKKRNLNKRMNEQDRMQYEKSRDYMVRVDDMLMCKNIKCRRRFEIPSAQSIVFI
jgi:ribosomal protein L44E